MNKIKKKLELSEYKYDDKIIFNLLIKLSLILFIIFLILSVMFKSIIPNDLIANYDFLSSLNLNERFVRGLKIVEFYQIEIQLGELEKALLLDLLNMVVFIPFGIFISHFCSNNRILGVFLITFVFSFIIEIFQLITIIGAFMLSDLIVNTFGGLIGLLIYNIVIKNGKYKLYNILLLIFITFVLVIDLFLMFNFIINIDVYSHILKNCLFSW